MLKGFATMPVILAVVMLIFGVAYVHLTDLDRSVADGIGKELGLRTLQIGSLEEVVAKEGELYSAAISTRASDRNDLANKLSSVTGKSVSVDSYAKSTVTAYYVLDYDKKSGDSSFSVSRNVSVEIECSKLNVAQCP